jgi:ElaB/YqjD/DUF883 family membrane-anchored ribosome-binding protein
MTAFDNRKWVRIFWKGEIKMTIQAVKEAKTDEKGFVKEALSATEKLVQKRLDVERLKEKASHAIEDGIVDAKRMIKKGRYAAEDLVDDTTHYIKHDPWRSVGVTFGIGLCLGTIIGLLVAKNSKRD